MPFKIICKKLEQRKLTSVLVYLGSFFIPGPPLFAYPTHKDPLLYADQNLLIRLGLPEEETSPLMLNRQWTEWNRIWSSQMHQLKKDQNWHKGYLAMKEAYELLIDPQFQEAYLGFRKKGFQDLGLEGSKILSSANLTKGIINEAQMSEWNSFELMRTKEIDAINSSEALFVLVERLKILNELMVYEIQNRQRLFEANAEDNTDIATKALLDTSLDFLVNKPLDLIRDKVFLSQDFLSHVNSPIDLKALRLLTEKLASLKQSQNKLLFSKVENSIGLIFDFWFRLLKQIHNQRFDFHTYQELIQITYPFEFELEGISPILRQMTLELHPHLPKFLSELSMNELENVSRDMTSKRLKRLLILEHLNRKTPSIAFLYVLKNLGANRHAEVSKRIYYFTRKHMPNIERTNSRYRDRFLEALKELEIKNPGNTAFDETFFLDVVNAYFKGISADTEEKTEILKYLRALQLFPTTCLAKLENILE
jgi:hypothetical protein